MSCLVKCPKEGIQSWEQRYSEIGKWSNSGVAAFEVVGADTAFESIVEAASDTTEVEAGDDRDVDRSPRCDTLAPHIVEDNDSLRGDGIDAIDDPAGVTWLGHHSQSTSDVL